MNSDWQVITSHFPPEVCDKIVEIGLCKPLDYAKIGGSEHGRIDFSHRRTKLRWLDVVEIDAIYSHIFLLVKQINRTFFNFDISHGVNEIQFTEYNSDDLGFYDWHMDTFYRSPELYDRKLTVVIQLTDPSEYEGGEFLFDRCEKMPDEKFRPRGSVVVFPSFNYHKVTEVTKGTRRSLVMWFEGPKWR